MKTLLQYLTLFLLFISPLQGDGQTVGLIQNTSDSYNGYTLIAPMRYGEVYLVDNCGYVVHQWNDLNPFTVANYLLPDGQLLRNEQINSDFTAGGTTGRIKTLDEFSNITWQIEYTSQTFHHHHDLEPLPNGNILVIAWELYTVSETENAGKDPSFISSVGIWSEKIVELKPIGTNEYEEVWVWKVWDHLIQDFNPLLPNYGVVADNVGKVDINFDNNLNPDWLHFNAIDYNAELDQIAISAHRYDEVWIIDHSTTTEEAATSEGGNAGKGGELLYRWGNPQVYQRGDATDQRLFNQHNIQWIPANHADEGKLLVYNNQAGDGYSTVEVISPEFDSEGNYALIEEGQFLPLEAEWSYGNSNSEFFYSPNISGAQRLPNGNTLICAGAPGFVFEINSDDVIVWQYQNPVTQAGPQTQGTVANGATLFRSERYPTYYSGLPSDLTPGDPIELEPVPYQCMITENPGCKEDFDGDEVVTSADLLIFLANFGNACICDPDLNNDGVVNSADLLNFLAAYGLSCYE